MRLSRRVMYHVLFWSLFWVVLTLYGGLYQGDFVTNAINVALDMPFTIACTYLFVYRILPLYFQRKWVAFALASSVVFAATVLSKRLFMQYVEFPWLYAGTGYTFDYFNWHRLVGHLVESVATAGFVGGLKFFRDWQRSKDKIEALSAEKRAAELSFLRAQVHPHFLFNTLNSIYYEVVRKGDGAGDLIIQLSDMLRFTLYECKGDMIPLSRELKLIESYIALGKCRFGDRLSVNLDVHGDPEQLVPPMICFGLVENAFKHGTTQKSGLIHIDIQIDADAKRLLMQVQNPCAPTTPSDDLGATKGIGLRNIRQQLQLLYDDQFELQLVADNERFVSRLQIPLHTTQP